MATPVLVSIVYSPWSLRARMALDLAGVAYTRREYLPTLGEPWLRWQTGRWRGPISVPVLLTDDGALNDSYDIAVWASERSGGALIPAGSEDRVRRINELSSRALAAGRLRTTRRVRAVDGALRESLPPPIRALGTPGLWIGRKVSNDLIRKYGGADMNDEAAFHEIDAALAGLRAEIGGRPTVLDGLSYADVTGAMALAFVAPHASARIGPLSRPLWTEPELADRYADLVAWRDRVYDAVAAKRAA